MTDQQQTIQNILSGKAKGRAVALRAGRTQATGQPALRLQEPCRIEHPRSAFVRKAAEREGQTAFATTLHAPDGRLTELRYDSPLGPAAEGFIKKPGDYAVLRSYLKDVVQEPQQARHPEPLLGLIGLSPRFEFQWRWHNPAALDAAQEQAASCLRKLERLYRRRCDEAARQGCCCAELSDLCCQPLPKAEEYWELCAQDVDYLTRQTHLPVLMALAGWDEELALFMAGKGLGLHLDGAWLPLLPQELLENAVLLLDWRGHSAQLCDIKAAAEHFSSCARAVLLVDSSVQREEYSQFLPA